MAEDIGDQIIEKAKSLGASLAGITSVNLVRESPSYKIHEKIYEGKDDVGASLGTTNVSEVIWPDNAKSVLVVALSHSLAKPELDWVLESGNTPGNWLLQKINLELSAWIEQHYGIKTYPVNYWVWEGGIYLKDAAVLSGIGCIGKNNLLVTPEFGPRVRFRAILLDDELTPTGPSDFDPCDGCEELCREVCPQHAFDAMVLSPDATGMSNLPGRNGSFSRPQCAIRSSIDQQNSGITISDPIEFWSEKKAVPGQELVGSYQTQKHMVLCRRCELACPVGNQ